MEGRPTRGYAFILKSNVGIPFQTEGEAKVH
jgi:hypothetical protein